jgi:hypothetical protein
MLEDLDEDDAKKLKYLAVGGVGLIVMLAILLFALDALGGGMKKKNKTKPSQRVQRSVPNSEKDIWS